MGNILHNKNDFVNQSERGNIEHDFFNNIFKGNEFCLITKSMTEKAKLFLIQTKFTRFLGIKRKVLFW